MDSPIENEIWVDPEYDFLMRRYESRIHEKPSITMDVTYEHDPGVGLMLSAWQYESLTEDGRSDASDVHRI